MRRARALIVALLVAIAGSAAEAQTPSAVVPLTLAGARERALAANPSIAAARLLRPIGAAGVAVAAERPNPEVAYEQSKETPHVSVGVTLPLELGGKRQRRVDLATASLAVSGAEVGKLVADLLNDVRRAYFDVVAGDIRVQVADDVNRLARRARDAASARVTAGDVPRSDLTQADLAVAKSDGDLAAARREATALRSELNALLGQPLNADLVLAGRLADGSLPSEADAVAQGLRENGDVRVLDRRIAEQAARISVAASLKTPDVSAGSTFTSLADPEFRYGWRVSVGVTLPVFSSHQAGIRLEQAALTQLKAEREALVARVNGGIVVALSRAAAARERFTHYQSAILPLSLEAEQQAQVAYSGGQIGLPALVQMLQIARDTRERGLDAGLEYQRALTNLEKAIGAAVQ